MKDIRNLVRSGIASLLYQAGLTVPASRGSSRLSIATFHRVLPEEQRRQYPYPGLVVTPGELDAVLHFFKDHYECGPLAGQHARHLAGDKSRRPLLALTFDDGQHDNFFYARPLLERHGLKATFFVPVAAIHRRELLWHDRLGFAVLGLLHHGEAGGGRLASILDAHGLALERGSASAPNLVRQLKELQPQVRFQVLGSILEAAKTDAPPAFSRMMTSDEVVTLSAEGHEIGSHSMTHCMMPECDDDSLQYEVVESRRILEAWIGRTVESFCYPNGDADTRAADAVARAGYRRAVTTAWGANRRNDGAFLLRRFDMDAARLRDSAGRIASALVAYRMSGLSWRPV